MINSSTSVILDVTEKYRIQVCEFLQECLNRKVMADMRSNKEGVAQAVLAVDVSQKESMPALLIQYSCLSSCENHESILSCN